MASKIARRASIVAACRCGKSGTTPLQRSENSRAKNRVEYHFLSFPLVARSMQFWRNSWPTTQISVVYNCVNMDLRSGRNSFSREVCHGKPVKSVICFIANLESWEEQSIRGNLRSVHSGKHARGKCHGGMAFSSPPSRFLRASLSRLSNADYLFRPKSVSSKALCDELLRDELLRNKLFLERSLRLLGPAVCCSRLLRAAACLPLSHSL